jgi:hypothetical protein
VKNGPAERASAEHTGLTTLAVIGAWRDNERSMFVLVRAAMHSALFIGLLLIFLPNRILSSIGITQVAAIDTWQVAGMLLGVSGAALASREEDPCRMPFVNLVSVGNIRDDS